MKNRFLQFPAGHLDAGEIQVFNALKSFVETVQ